VFAIIGKSLDDTGRISTGAISATGSGSTTGAVSWTLGVSTLYGADALEVSDGVLKKNHHNAKPNTATKIIISMVLFL
jgi:hypothetical protein